MVSRSWYVAFLIGVPLSSKILNGPRSTSRVSSGLTLVSGILSCSRACL
jgi:hypothetical protein